MKDYEIKCGGFETPENGTIKMPPRYCGRKDIEPGEMVIVTNLTPLLIAKRLRESRERGEKEMVAVNKTARKDEGR